eukprot:CAMPEP_0113624060 /NCGR_PEP_ID=MMETSP0017_2-20120614/12397_1 /TAXON_ID=2856 /ORGANISM="Cylindrotheca closterium" /LENGTH=68 /DNA_ID=CAMNT_0000534067 /DNA_START=623 /DNA_END=825 /DNA_ORIENTATION=- /assembly_acc=CAM_ASM_000147
MISYQLLDAPSENRCFPTVTFAHPKVGHIHTHSSFCFADVSSNDSDRDHPCDSLGSARRSPFDTLQDL